MVLFIQYPLQLQRPRGQRHVGFDALAVEIAAAGDVQAVFFRQVKVECLLLRRVFGIMALNGVQTAVRQLPDQALQSRAVNANLVRMSQGNLAACGLDGFYAGPNRRLGPLDPTVEFLRVQIAVKRLPVAGHIPVSGERLGKVGPAHDFSARQSLHPGKVNDDSLLLQKVDDAQAPLVPAVLHLPAQRRQRWSLRVDVVAQNMESMIFPRTQFDAPDDPQAQLLPGADRFLQTVQGVMVRERQDFNAAFFCQGHYLRGRILAVGGGGVGVEVRNYHDASYLLEC